MIPAAKKLANRCGEPDLHHLTLSVRVRRTGDTTSFSEIRPKVDGSAGPKKRTWRHIFAHPCSSKNVVSFSSILRGNKRKSNFDSPHIVLNRNQRTGWQETSPGEIFPGSAVGYKQCPTSLSHAAGNTVYSLSEITLNVGGIKGCMNSCTCDFSAFFG